MLDAWIVEELRREEREKEERPFLELELPLDPPMGDRAEREESPEKSDRGVTIIDLLG